VVVGRGAGQGGDVRAVADLIGAGGAGVVRRILLVDRRHGELGTEVRVCDIDACVDDPEERAGAMGDRPGSVEARARQVPLHDAGEGIGGREGRVVGNRARHVAALGLDRRHPGQQPQHASERRRPHTGRWAHGDQTDLRHRPAGETGSGPGQHGLDRADRR